MSEAAAANNTGLSNDEKTHVGNFTFTLQESDISHITENIGEILEAQVILRGSNTLGYGKLFLKTPGEAAPEGSLEGTTKLGRPRAAKGRGRGRGKGRAAGGRARRSADDPDALDEAAGAGGAPGSEGAAQNGETSVKAVTDEVAKMTTGKGKKGKNARQPRQKKERGEPSKTLIFVRNLPYTHDEAAVSELLSSSGVSFSKLSIPVWNHGPHKGQGRGYAFVTVSDEEAQKGAIAALDGKELTTTVQPREGAPEGTEPKELSLKVQARQGYENDEQNEKEAAEGQNEAGPNDSGTAEAEATPAGADATPATA